MIRFVIFTFVTVFMLSGNYVKASDDELKLEPHASSPATSATIMDEAGKDLDKKPDAKPVSALQTAMNTANFIYNEAPPIKEIADGYKAVYDKSIADASAEILDRVRNGKSANCFVNNLIGAKHGVVNSTVYTVKTFFSPIFKFFTGYDISSIVNKIGEYVAA